MKLIGIIVLVAGLLLGAYALTMDVGVDVPARDFGYGVATPAMRVANVDLMTQRQNYLIFSGILAVVGAILTGFASMQPKVLKLENRPEVQASVNTLEPPAPSVTIMPTSVSVCPNCRSMGSGDLVNCARCGTPIGS